MQCLMPIKFETLSIYNDINCAFIESHSTMILVPNLLLVLGTRRRSKYQKCDGIENSKTTTQYKQMVQNEIPKLMNKIYYSSTAARYTTTELVTNKSKLILSKFYHWRAFFFSFITLVNVHAYYSNVFLDFPPFAYDITQYRIGTYI